LVDILFEAEIDAIAERERQEGNGGNVESRPKNVADERSSAVAHNGSNVGEGMTETLLFLQAFALSLSAVLLSVGHFVFFRYNHRREEGERRRRKRKERGNQ
jgi:hypothetical protein